MITNTKFPKITSFTGYMEMLATTCEIIMNLYIAYKNKKMYLGTLPVKGEQKFTYQEQINVSECDKL